MISTRGYKDTLKYRKSNGSMQSKAYKIFKSSKNFSIIIDTKTSILE